MLIDSGVISWYKNSTMPFWRRKAQAQEEDISDWLETFMPIYKESQPLLERISGIEPSFDSLDKMNAVISILAVGCMKLPTILEAAKEIPQPRHKELRKLKQEYVDALTASIYACHHGTKWAQKSTSKRYAQIAYFASMTKGIMERISKRLEHLS